jgi:thymidylate synthase (FAD)
MKIIEQSVEIITEPNPLKRIELVGRVCWKSEHRITEDSAKPFVAGLIKRGHTSPLEHARVVVPRDNKSFMLYSIREPYGYSDRRRSVYKKGCVYADVVNVRDLWNMCSYFNHEKDFVSEVEKLENAKDYMTVKFTTDIGMTRELIRHRQMSFMELSTRYVNYEDGIEFVKPLRYDDNANLQTGYNEYLSVVEMMYKDDIKHGLKPQEARAVLPLCTKTELYMTGMLSQWKDVFALRESPAAHPQMRDLMALLREEMEKKGIEVK